jgi:Cu(I)/Ag(I) efflux system periplasmic protein CusF
MKRIIFPLATIFLLAGLPAFAADGHAGHHGSMHMSSSHAASATSSVASNDALVDGEVRKVDRDAGKVTIKHGPLANLDMPAMTMVFHVKEPAMLDRVKAGDAIRFKAEKVGGNYTVTEIAKK